MKCVVFDNAGTLLRRVTAIKQLETSNIFYETNTIGIANEKPGRIIVVMQQPTKELIKHDKTIAEYMKENPEKFEISYSQKSIEKQQLIEKLENDTTKISQITTTAKALIRKYDIEICSGSAIIIDTTNGVIEYVYTAGGVFFNETKNTINTLNENSYEVYIASGDNKQSLNKIAQILGVNPENVYDTANREIKKQIVETLQNQGNYVYMVGNNTNDELALKSSDTSILTVEQKEELPEYLLKSVDYKIDSIGEVIDIILKNN
ncbi:MAG: HAD family hydrolase [Methanosphaera sp.]|uniref:HAD family hydrolase n=1 Tax=Methanosphaera sp. TaxID=2666342 RepID=UPI0025D2954B|nr:HAD family hydrolase [Methanosphaera sp.]MCI5867575.1 HAD family hydrolase [Methanosphaera sp.]MDD6534042.1 HAD family hydrolase [Methanosphaera sp.]MDY3956148.1 HAD family hydrolase [Methanosphaera sp.]